MKCSRCDSLLPKGKVYCQSCRYFNTGKSINGDGVIRLIDAQESYNERFITGPWDICFGPAHTDPEGRFIKPEENGLTRSSVTLIGGAPGAGKSTLSLQLVDAIAAAMNRDILYVLAEENASQVKARALRLGIKNMVRILALSALEANAEVNFNSVLDGRKPCAVIVDSVSGLTSDLAKQVDICKAFKEFSTKLNAPFIGIMHLNKDDNFAGLRALEFAVDTTIILDTDIDSGIRIMQTTKNRFGTAPVQIFFTMTESRGLVLKTFNEEPTNEET